MALQNEVKNIILDSLKKAPLSTFATYTLNNQKIVTSIYNAGIITTQDIESALEHAVFWEAAHDYIQMTGSMHIAQRQGRSLYPDHLVRADCFAYALEKGKFDAKQREEIPFDHGDTIETFIQQYGRPDLLQILRTELLNPKPLISTTPTYSNGC